LVVEDHPQLQWLLVEVLRKAGYEVDAEKDGQAGWRTLSARRPDLAIVDIELPGLDGLELCKRIRADAGTRNTAIIIISGRGDVNDRVTGLERGADDYIVKPFETREVIARVQAALRRLHPAPATSRRIGTLELDEDTHVAALDGMPLDLTAREFALLAVLVHGNGRTVRRSTLLREAWGVEHEHEISSRTVDVHVARLRQKLGAEAPRLVTVKGVGYRFDIS
jgi:DNA-binding response OmpR family regulator